jgi:hypothetical protein
VLGKEKESINARGIVTFNEDPDSSHSLALFVTKHFPNDALFGT